MGGAVIDEEGSATDEEDALVKVDDENDEEPNQEDDEEEAEAQRLLAEQGAEGVCLIVRWRGGWRSGLWLVAVCRPLYLRMVRHRMLAHKLAYHDVVVCMRL
jgi:hypothetical protein